MNFIPSDPYFVLVVDDAYRFEYGPDRKTIKATVVDFRFANGFFGNSTLRVMRATQDEVVLEAPIRPHTRNDLRIGPEYVAIHVVWQRIKNPDDKKKWGDLIHANPTLPWMDR